MHNVTACGGAKSRERPLTLERALDSLYSGALDSGFEGVGYTFVPAHQLELSERRPPVMGSRTAPEIPAGWPQHYLKQELYRFDPVVAACRRTTLPVWWGEEAERTFVCDAQIAATAGQVNLLRRCVRETGVRAGVSVPLHSPSGGYGYVVFVSRLALHQIRKGTAQEDRLLGLAHRFHHSLPHFASVALPDIKLSAREVECLQLVGCGRTLDEIAVLVGISFGTVRFHLRNACRKLGVTNRLQALSKASYLGLIQQESGLQRLDLDT